MRQIFLRATSAIFQIKTWAVLAGLAIVSGWVLFPGSASATTQVGYSSASTRSQINSSVYSTQWVPAPLFNFVLQTSNVNWGYDLIHATNTFAVAAADGTPSQSGWHSHPVPLGLVQVTQGGLWIVEASDLTCLTYYPTGSMFVEMAGHPHNAYNFDQKTPAVTLATWFMERYLASTRIDQPDPTTGNPTVAVPPPTALCQGSPVPPPTN
jgi:hypothetical protein